MPALAFALLIEPIRTVRENSAKGSASGRVSRDDFGAAANGKKKPDEGKT